MLVIRDKDGNIISRSQDLRGIRRYVGSYHAGPIKMIDISQLPKGEGKLSILFENGANFETNFASFTVLEISIANWRNLYGARISVDGEVLNQPVGKWMKGFAK